VDRKLLQQHGDRFVSGRLQELEGALARGDASARSNRLSPSNRRHGLAPMTAILSIGNGDGIDPQDVQR
jgi:hypothetical protein